MKYYELEHQPLEEVLAFRNSCRGDFMRVQDKLNARKNELFKKPKSQWGFNGS